MGAAQRMSCEPVNDDVFGRAAPELCVQNRDSEHHGQLSRSVAGSEADKLMTPKPCES